MTGDDQTALRERIARIIDRPPWEILALPDRMPRWNDQIRRAVSLKKADAILRLMREHKEQGGVP
jgi:hypothetical protein